MAENSRIEWTDDTWNPVTGCSVVSPGCTNCYAMRLAGTRLRDHPSRTGLTSETKAGPVWNGQVRLNEGWLAQPMRSKRPRIIFVCAPRRSVPRVRPGRMDRSRVRGHGAVPAAHVPGADEAAGADAGVCGGCHGAGCRCRAAAKGGHPCGRAAPAYRAWNPLVAAPERLARSVRRGPAPRRRAHPGPAGDAGGGESGPGARPMHPDWARSLRDQCAAAGVPFFFKQWGEWLEADQFFERIERGH